MIDERPNVPNLGLPNDLYQLVALGRLEGKMDLALNRLTDHIADDRAQFARIEALRQQQEEGRQKAERDDRRSSRATFRSNAVLVLAALIGILPAVISHALSLIGR